jgi:hypothetical protein
VIGGLKASVCAFSDAEQSALFHHNARRVYRVDALRPQLLDIRWRIQLRWRHALQKTRAPVSERASERA